MKSGRGDKRDRPLHVQKADEQRERVGELAFARYVREAAGVEPEELPAEELRALETIYKWGTGPTQIVRTFEGETFMQIVDRVQQRVRRVQSAPPRSGQG